MIERWELLQAQDLSKERSSRQQQQLTSDLGSVCSWLEEAEEELQQQRGRGVTTDMQTIQLHIRKLKVILDCQNQPEPSTEPSVL